MTSSPSAERQRPRLRALPLAAVATGLAVALLAPPPNIAQEVLDTQGLAAVCLTMPAELIMPDDATAEPEPRAPVETALDEPDIEADTALPEPAAGPAEPASPSPASRSEVTVRAGLHPTFQRFVFDWPHAVEVDTEQTGDTVVVRFADPARFRPDGSVPAGQLAVPEPRAVTIRAIDVAEVKSFSLADHRVVVDLYHSRPPAERRAVPDPATTSPAAPHTEDETEDAAEDHTADQLAPLGLLHAELYRRDLMIASLLARLEAVERGGPSSRGTALPPPFILSDSDGRTISGCGATGSAPVAGSGGNDAAA